MFLDELYNSNESADDSVLYNPWRYHITRKDYIPNITAESSSGINNVPPPINNI